MTKLSFKTYSQLSKDIRQAIKLMPNDVDLVVGNPRSGMIPAYMIGAFLNLPVASLDEYLNDINTSSGDRPIVLRENKNKKVLIVDDSVDSGNAIKKIKNKLAKKNNSVEYIFFAVYATKKGKELIDYCAILCEQPRIFQWNYLYHSILGNSCFDIDGVLCLDPTSEQNDDGEKYEHFILNAKPLYIPNYKIKALVTSRLEKYRRETEEWLKKNNVQYEKLFMLNLTSKKERVEQMAHGKFKSEIYNNLNDCFLFIESEREQAIEIANLTGKPVICLSTDEMFPSSEVEVKNFSIKSDEDMELIKFKLIEAEKNILALKKSKSFKIGDLFFRSIKNPYKLITFPFNFVRILFGDENQ